MSRPYWQAKHVRTLAELPEKLTRGRAYFIDDEQYIIIDHGQGPVIYGNRPGPQGASGEPQPSLQSQIDELAAASLRNSVLILEANKYRKKNVAALQSSLNDAIEQLKQSDADNASAILNLLVTVNRKFDEYDSAISILIKSITNLYPSWFSATAGDGISPVSAGEIITSNGSSWIVDSAYRDSDSGVVVLTLRDTSSPALISTLKEGDTVTYDSGYFTVNHMTGSSDSGVIALTLYPKE